jgi:hypothetical protein
MKENLGRCLGPFAFVPSFYQHPLDPDVPTEGPSNLLGVTIRRAFISGRLFVIYGIAVSGFLGFALSFSGGTAFASAFPYVLPLFAVVGSMGSIVVFTNDRLKGVLEYLLAYGESPRRIFVNVLAASLVLVTVVMAVALGIGIGIFVGRGHALTSDFLELIGLYSIPMCYASAAFAATVCMFWTSLSSPRTGINSPIGLAPFFGILPSITTLGLLILLGVTGNFSSAERVDVGLGVVVAVAVAVVLLLATMGRFLRREQLLSPA